MKKWKVADDCFVYILRNNLTHLIEKIVKDFKLDARFVATLFAHKLKYCEGHLNSSQPFDYKSVYNLIKFVKDSNLENEILKKMLPIYYEHPQMEMGSILRTTGYKEVSKKSILDEAEKLKGMFNNIRYKHNKSETAETDWIMGNIKPIALGNMSLAELRKEVDKIIT